MKNIICPISEEKVQEHIPRLTAFFAVSLFVTYLFTGFLPIVIFLALDFLARGFNRSKFSVLANLAVSSSKLLKIQSAQINKAPKLFAARLGGLMSILIIASHILDVSIGAVSLTTIIISLSTLEFAFGVCVGCYLYSWFVVPFYKRRSTTKLLLKS